MSEAIGPAKKAEPGHETRDVSVRNLELFALGLLVLIAFGMLASLVVFNYFVAHQGLGPPASPFENVRSLPPGNVPVLETNPARDASKYRKEQRAVLESYGWVDEQQGVARIPIERAMDILLDKGFPVASSAPAGANRTIPPHGSAAKTQRGEAARSLGARVTDRR